MHFTLCLLKPPAGFNLSGVRVLMVCYGTLLKLHRYCNNNNNYDNNNNNNNNNNLNQKSDISS